MLHYDSHFEYIRDVLGYIDHTFHPKLEPAG